MKGFHMRIAAIIFGVLVIGFGVIPRCGDIRVTKSWRAEHTSEFKKKDITKHIALAQSMGKDLEKYIHPSTNNLVHPGTEDAVGSRIFHEIVLFFHFGEKVYKRGKKKGKPVLDKDGNPKPKQKVAFGISFGVPVYRTYECVLEDYNCELGIIKGYRSAGEQFWNVWVSTLGKAGPLPFKGKGGHSIGRACDLHRTCMDHRIPLGKIDGKVVWFGTEPKKRRGTRGIKPDPATKETVLKWIREVRFEKEFDELEKLPGYNNKKCLDFAYNRVRWLIASNLEGAHMVAFECAKENGLTGAACTKVRLLDAGHYSEVRSSLVDNEDGTMTPQEIERAQKVEIYQDCHRDSEKWNDYYYRSVLKANSSLKWSYDESLRITAPGLILFPPSKCTGN